MLNCTRVQNIQSVQQTIRKILTNSYSLFCYIDKRRPVARQAFMRGSKHALIIRDVFF